MRVMQLRIIGWGTVLLCAGWLLWCRGNHGEPSPRQLITSPTETPRLFRADDSAIALDSADGSLSRDIKPVSVRSLSQRGPDQGTANVIREPGGGKDDLAYDSAYQLDGGEKPSPPELPLELLLNGPRAEPATVAPRVTREMTSEPALVAPPPTPLVIHSGSSPALRPVNALAHEHVVRGFSLGDKGAIYAARVEFIQALRTIAQALDAQAQLAPKDPQSCSQALARGIQALSEADDFVPTGSRLDGDLDLAAIIAAHRTPAAKKPLPASQLAALQAYFDFARDELKRAAADNPVASQALTGLGKTYTTTTQKSQNRLAPAKAMVFHQAAVGIDGSNHLAANELGVLLARHGQWQPAKQAFVQSLRVQRDAATWQNLAEVHRRLGERELAQLAEQERQLLLREQPANTFASIDGKPTVQWVDPRTFAGPPEEGQPAIGSPVPATARRRAPSATVQKAEGRPGSQWR